MNEIVDVITHDRMSHFVFIWLVSCIIIILVGALAAYKAERYEEEAKRKLINKLRENGGL